MKKLLKNKKTLIISAAMLVAAVALIATASIGVSRATLTYVSETWAGHVEMYDIGVSLVEQCAQDDAGHIVSWRNYIQNSDGQWDLGKEALVQHMLADGEELQIAKTYDEALSVYNSGTINEYVRVTVYKYWVDKDGNKDTTIDPNLIDLHFTNLDSDWLLDSQDGERTVLYYNKLLNSGESTAEFTDTLTIYIDDTIAQSMTKSGPDEDGIITYTYDYNGYQFQIEAEVDVVQEHNAEDAVLSAWGENVTISNGTLSIN